MMRNIHLVILGGAAIVSGLALAVIARFDISALNAFGPVARIYFGGIKNGLIVSTAILFLCFIFFLFAESYFDKVLSQVRYFYASISNRKKNILILSICLIFSFASHAGNITNGYFNMDDFVVVGMNNSLPFSQSVITPYGNDHLIPLFKAEMKALGALFGQNPVPHNVFIFIMFALIPFFTYLTLKKLGIGIQSFFVFLILFSGATSWADMLTGFNIMSIYPQTILFFSVASWAYLAWAESKEKKYMAFFAASILCAVTIDTSGIWVIPALLLFMATVAYLKTDTLKIGKKYLWNLFKENKIPFCIVAILIFILALFFYISFVLIQPNTFLSTLSGDSTETDASILLKYKKENWRLIPLTSNFLSFFENGVSLSMFAPNIVKILVHPAMKNKVAPSWPVVEMILLFGNAILFWFALKYASNKEKKLMILLLAIMTMTIAMVIVARPIHEIIPDFDYRYTGVPYYFYSLFMAICASMLMRTKKDYAVKVILSAVIVVFAGQQALSFYAVRLKEEAKLRREAVVRLNASLLAELDALQHKKNAPLVIPNLSGGHIFQPMPGLMLSHFLLFFNTKAPITLIKNSQIPVDTWNHFIGDVSSLRSETSQEFKEALKKPSAIRSYYASPSLMTYKNSDSPGNPTQSAIPNGEKEVIIQHEKFDPEKIHVLGFSLSTDNTPGNLELSFSFKNDFNVDGAAGKIRIDDYTPYLLKDGRRVYAIESDLLQLYTFSLSEKISDLTLSVPETKSAFVHGIYFR